MSIIAALVDSSISDKYKSPETPYFVPQQEKVDPKDKNTPQYCAKICKAAFSALMRNRHSLPAYYYSKINILRNYLHGNQDEAYYINLIKKSDPQGATLTVTDQYNNTYNKQAQMEGYEHLQPQIVSSMPAIRQAIQGLFSDYDEYSFVQTIDDESGKMEEEAVAKAFADITLKPFTDQLNQMGVPIVNEPEFPLDTTKEELDIYKDMGGFKAKWAEGLEQIIFFTQKQSDWDTVMKRKYIDDYLALNFCMAREVYDNERDICRWEYVDPANATIQYSTDRLFGDAEKGGYFTLEKISKLVKLGFDSEELRKTAKQYSGMYDNARLEDTGFSTPTKVQTDRILDFRVPVFHYYWIETDVKRRLKTKHPYGEKSVDLSLHDEIRPLSDYQVKKGMSQKEVKTRIRRTYKCSWVVDTEMVYDFGILENQARKSKKEPQIPLRAYKEVTTNTDQLFGSIVEHVIPFLDRQQLLWLKYQDALMKAHPGGYMINWRLLQNLENGGKAINPLEAFEMFWKYGRGIYADTAYDGKYEGGAVLPISQIPGNYGELLAVLSNEMEYIKGQIRDYTGIDPTTVGVSAQGNTATEVSLAKQGTNNILRPMLKAIFTLKGELANYTSRSVQLNIKNKKECYDAYTKVVGEDVTKLLLNLERDGVDYGMYMEAKPSDEEVASLIEAANAAMATGRDGESQIDLGQWMYLQERIMNGGNIKKLRRDVAFMIRKKKEEDHQMKLERERVQAQAQAEVVQMTNQAKQQESQMKAQADILLQDKKTKDQIMIDKNNSDLSIKEQVILKKLEAESEEDGKSEV
jgi:hypothetical protein